MVCEDRAVFLFKNALNGRRVMNPTKGVYIVNGKKILEK